MTQSTFKDVQNAISEHVAKGVLYRMYVLEVKHLLSFTLLPRAVFEHLQLDWFDEEMLTTDIGECIMVEGERVKSRCPY